MFAFAITLIAAFEFILIINLWQRLRNLTSDKFPLDSRFLFHLREKAIESLNSKKSFGFTVDNQKHADTSVPPNTILWDKYYIYIFLGKGCVWAIYNSESNTKILQKAYLGRASAILLDSDFVNQFKSLIKDETYSMSSSKEQTLH